MSFFFGRLGVFLKNSGGWHPQVGFFVALDFACRPLLLELYPLIQYHLVSKMVEERVASSEVRSGELGTSLSFSNDLVGMEVDMVMSKPSTSSFSKPFQALWSVS